MSDETKQDAGAIKVSPVYRCPFGGHPIFLYDSGAIVPHYAADGKPCAANGTKYAEHNAGYNAQQEDAGAQCPCRKAVPHIQEAMDIIDSARFNRFIYENLYLARKILSTPCPLEAERNMWQDAHDYMNRRAAEAIVECDRIREELRELRKGKERMAAALLDCLEAMVLRQESNQEAYDIATINARAAMKESLGE